MTRPNETHDPALRSWVESANATGSDFPIQNLPLGVFRRRGSGEAFRCGAAIGEAIVDLAAVHAAGVFAEPSAAVFGDPATGVPGDPATGASSARAGAAVAACTGSSLNALMAMGPAAWSELRLALSRALRAGSAAAERLRTCLVARADAEYTVPARIGDYTDFYASIHHATSVGRLFRPDHPLLPNYKWVPIGYHGRASSIVVSGTPVRRPIGQTLPAGAQQPVFGPSLRLDFELELGAYIGTGNALGSRIALDDAEQHVFGVCLLNDWSARDVQSWEYQPLGPFLAKNFATTVSPWIVSLEALAPYRVEWSRPAEDPQPLSYLESAANRAAGAFDIRVGVWLQTARMRETGEPPQCLSHTSFRHAYWTLAQLVAHHTVNGCNLQSGDLLGTGTLSGPTPDEAGALLELAAGGKKPLTLANGERRAFLEDGDTVILRGWCERPGAARIGFGEAVGRLLPAIA